ncbi:pre-mRNA cleavage and polyadenylation [Ordospora colligata]|uniref:Pre-mRNA cleavage and polyadenylation n=1 Tax=Ordospora colligata OC4 TaxID=1354746 RepID=A0A0B2UHZ9_9MICR|nr:pre-mRNA cleavage and polyadenylation [Ordospora colligata OC4]KHN68829.1 pre-mRNA cleavage and polyadenylation [Ordospora colligata OC4]TBU13863.1 pre-mRNA cleavage and polyadenylation [Ordospora colligata]TBU17721.1 pre-mRNA cleavage and polyadenylation [Ordospora colligata]
MGYLYSQECVWNGVEGCCAGLFMPGVECLVTYNRNTIKLWRCKGGLMIVKEHVLFERICRIEKYEISDGHDGVVILFDKAKICVAIFEPCTNVFETVSLKFFERDEYDSKEEDIRNMHIAKDVGIVHISKRYFGVFGLRQGVLNAKAFRFADVDSKIRNPVDFVFIGNYSTPTVCLVYESSPKKYTSIKNRNAIIFSIDLSTGGFHVVDEFDVPPKTFKVAYTGTAMLFISHSSIMIRTPSSSYTLPVNRMSECYGSDKVFEEAVLFDVSCFAKGSVCLLLNGNGDRYKLSIDMDMKRIIGACLKFDGKDATVSGVCSVNNFVFFGSMVDESRLFVVDEHNKQDNELIETSGRDDEYARLFSTEANKRLKDDFALELIDVMPNVGGLNGMTMKSNGQAIFAVEGLQPCLCIVSGTIPFEIVKSVKVKKYRCCMKAMEYYMLSKEFESKVFRWDDDFIQVDGEYERRVITIGFGCLGRNVAQVMTDSCLLMDGDLKLIRKFDFDEAILESKIVCGGMFLVTRDKSRKMVCYDEGMNVTMSVCEVTCFCDVGGVLFVVLDEGISVFDLQTCRQYMVCKVRMDGAIQMTPYEEPKKDKQPKKSKYRNSHADTVELSCSSDIVEIHVSRTKRKVLMLLRTNRGEMIAYEALDDECLRYGTTQEAIFNRIMLPKCVFFKLDNDEKGFYGIGEMVFMKSTINMFLLATDKGYYMYRSKHSLNSIYIDAGQAIHLSRGHLVVMNVPKPECEQYVFGNGYVGQKVPVMRTPKYVENARGYTVVAACEEAEFLVDEEKDYGVPVTTFRFSIDLYSEKYEYISTYGFDENEHVFYVKYLTLDDRQGNHGKSQFLVVCTTMIEGEDKPAKGRLHVLEIISVVPEPENPFKDCKMKVLGIEKTKGSIVQCEEIRGKIALCLGTKIMIYKVDRSKGIIPVGFYDLHIFTSSISVVKNYILASDIYRGLSFFYLQSKPIRLHLIGSSGLLRNAVNTEFLAVNDELSMQCSDDRGTIHIYTYSPNSIISMDGTKLVKRAEITTKLGRLSSNSVGFKKSGTLFYSRTNILIHICSIDEGEYSRLLELQSLILSRLPVLFGVNPRDYLSSDIHLHELSLKGPIVHHALSMFEFLDTGNQHEVSNLMNMSRTKVIELIASLNKF